MREFFKPWRRKLAVPLLLVASVLAGAWLRSAVLKDIVVFTLAGRRFVILNHASAITWFVRLPQPDDWAPYWVSDRPFPPIGTTDWNDLSWTRVCLIIEVTDLENWRRGRYSLPHWLSLPITLFAAVLLIWPTRRKATPQPAIPPADSVS